mgnify:CR=1 FL=1
MQLTAFKHAPGGDCCRGCVVYSTVNLQHSDVIKKFPGLLAPGTDWSVPVHGVVGKLPLNDPITSRALLPDPEYRVIIDFDMRAGDFTVTYESPTGPITATVSYDPAVSHNGNESEGLVTLTISDDAYVDPLYFLASSVASSGPDWFAGTYRLSICRRVDEALFSLESPAPDTFNNAGGVWPQEGIRAATIAVPIEVTGKTITMEANCDVGIRHIEVSAPTTEDWVTAGYSDEIDECLNCRDWDSWVCSENPQDHPGTLTIEALSDTHTQTNALPEFPIGVAMSAIASSYTGGHPGAAGTFRFNNSPSHGLNLISFYLSATRNNTTGDVQVGLSMGLSVGNSIAISWPLQTSGYIGCNSVWQFSIASAGSYYDGTPGHPDPTNNPGYIIVDYIIVNNESVPIKVTGFEFSCL